MPQKKPIASRNNTLVLADQKKKLLFLIAGLAFVFLLLSASLSQLQLNSGEPLPNLGRLADEVDSQPIAPFPAAANNLLLPVAQGVLAFLFVLVLFSIFLNIILRVPWKKLLWAVVLLVILAGALAWLSNFSFNPTSASNSGATGGFSPSGQRNPVISALGEPPPRFLWITFAIFISLLAAGGYALYQQREQHPHNELFSVLQEAQTALDALACGHEAGSVIVRCYQQMSRSIQVEMGLQRDAAMTPAEFMRILTERGLPVGALSELTHLFEMARYGGQVLDSTAQQSAKDSLTEIIHHCQGSQP